MKTVLIPLLLIVWLTTGCTSMRQSAPSATQQSTIVAGLASQSVVPEAGASDAAAKAARLRLTRDGLENPALASIVQIVPETWRDDCLELPSAIECHPTPTPGYDIEMEREGQRYLVRTNQDGTLARIAQSPVEPLTDAFIQWRYFDGTTCQTAEIGTEQVHYGLCGEAMLAVTPRPNPWDEVTNGQSQASYLKQKYAPFTANTIRGTLVFNGTGTTTATEAEQRSIAEWASDRFAEARLSYLPADHGLWLSWQERSTSLCGSLWVYQNGMAVARDCKGIEELGREFLSVAQLQQFYKWMDSGKRFELVSNDQGEGNLPSLALHFSDRLGCQTCELATAEEVDQMLRFAREVYVDLTHGTN